MREPSAAAHYPQEFPLHTLELETPVTIGYRRLSRFEPVRVEAIRLTIEDATEPALPVTMALYTG